MARFLFTVWPITGHLHSSMSVVLALKARGHEVGFYTGGPARALIEGAGFAFFGFDRIVPRLHALVDGAMPIDVLTPEENNPRFYDYLMARYSHSYQSLGRTAWTWTAMYREWILGTVPDQVADLEVILDRWHPDAIVSDPLIWSTFLVLLETRRQPVAILSFLAAGCLLPGPDSPPNGLGLPRPRDWSTRLLSSSVTLLMDALASPMRHQASQIRQRYGLPPLQGSVLAHSARVPLYLACSTPELDYLRSDLPPSVHYVGACTWDRPIQAAASEWLTALGTERPAVFVTEGTAQVAGWAVRRSVVLRAAIQGLGDLPIDVILCTGGRDPQQLDLGPVPPNMRVVQYVPYSPLYSHLSLVVTNVGIHGVRGMLAAGLPLIAVPMEWDQFEGAQRIAESGVGIRISVKKCTPERLRAAVQRILTEPSFRDNARKMAQAFARYGNADTAARLLETTFAKEKSA